MSETDVQLVNLAGYTAGALIVAVLGIRWLRRWMAT